MSTPLSSPSQPPTSTPTSTSSTRTGHPRAIREGDVVTTVNGRRYRVERILKPASGGHYKANRTYEVVSLEDGLPNAFDGTEITLEIPTPTPATTQSGSLSPQQRAALRTALDRMPYLPGVEGDYRPSRDLETVDSLVDLLTRLGDHLRVVGAQHREDKNALRALQSDVEAFRRLMGTAPSTSTQEG